MYKGGGGGHFTVHVSIKILLPPPGVAHPVPISLEAMSKPRPGYKVVKPPFPPHFSGSIPTAATGILHHTTGTAIGSHAYPPQPPLPSAGLYHPTGGGPLPLYQERTGVSVSVPVYSVFSPAYIWHVGPTSL